MASRQRYIPALNDDRLTPLYDSFQRWVMRESGFKPDLVRQAGLGPGQRVLDLGCGTGTLTLMLKRACPEAAVAGLDGDPRALRIARRKAARASLDIAWCDGLANELPYHAETFDRVVSCLMLHHLDDANKQRAMAEVFRVLRPGGEAHIVDFGAPRSAYGRLWAPAIRYGEHGASHVDGRLPGMLQAAGLSQVAVRRNFTTIFGDLSALRAGKPA